jgi:predicted RND superfamily exporter protein
MLGMLQFFGLCINGITYICIVVAIGLLVDFLLHILLRYYECSSTSPSGGIKSRDERVKETLETMGVSILVGGLTTFLGIIPAAISSLEIFMSVFYSFFSMVVLGCTHGLILLPVLLSYFGPTISVRGTYHHVHSSSASSSSTGHDDSNLHASSSSSSSDLPGGDYETIIRGGSDKDEIVVTNIVEV